MSSSTKFLGGKLGVRGSIPGLAKTFFSYFMNFFFTFKNHYQNSDYKKQDQKSIPKCDQMQKTLYICIENIKTKISKIGKIGKQNEKEKNLGQIGNRTTDPQHSSKKRKATLRKDARLSFLAFFGSKATEDI